MACRRDSVSSCGESLDRELSCSICFELFCDPTCLPCDHNYCLLCIQQLSDGPTGWITCPDCRQQCERERLRPNRLLASIVSTYKDLKLQEDERSKALDGGRGDRMCRNTASVCLKHKETLKLFCEDDQTAICLICGLSKAHKDHQLKPIEEAEEQYQKKKSQDIQKIEDYLIKVNSSWREQKNQISEVKMQLHFLTYEIRSQFDQMHQYLYKEEKEAISELKEEGKWAIKSLEAQLQLITQEKNLLEAELEFLKKEDDDWITNLQKSKTSKRSMEKVEMPDAMSYDLAHGVHRGPVQYRTWKRMLNIVQIGPTKLTLDPESAHPSLELTSDYTSVQDYSKDVTSPDRPKCFYPCLDLLSSQGFSSGKHYWEVLVPKERGWALGIAGESVNRKGNISLTAKNEFWAMWIEDGKFCISEAPFVVAPVVNSPRVIGVYLDKNAGQVSFYNADDMSHIHTILDELPRKVFPYFSLGIAKTGLSVKSGCLSLHHVQL
ncbi:nuclear factor 7, brain-like isoform X1 [Polypterus senegalus]|uniref:nuclear factor 7, brain-like isoform X1 n=2 Tax=Polypterus senegalus TaxID=55291 RepID=UPI00196509F5|nr:nuclear factor 7, brain-like isoform X1 [Polypterus senegalus]